MRNNIFVLILIFLVVSNCKSATVQGLSSIPEKGLGPIAQISLGESKTYVRTTLGAETSLNSEKFPSAEYGVLEYSKPDGVPSGYISLDPDTGRVAGRSVWISEAQPEQDFSYLQSRMFPKMSFETFISCDKHHADEIKVNRDNGVFVGMSRGHVILVSWSDARLTKLRVQQFFLKCPERQSHEQ